MPLVNKQATPPISKTKLLDEESEVEEIFVHD